MDADLAVGLVGADVAGAADSIGGCGAKFYGVSGEEFAAARYASDLAAVEAIAKHVALKSSWLRPFPLQPCSAGTGYSPGRRVDTHLSGLETVDGKPVANVGSTASAWKAP